MHNASRFLFTRVIGSLLSLGGITTACAPRYASSLAKETAAGGTAFVDVAVIPMDRERVLIGQTVLVQGNRITAMGPAGRVRVPAGLTRVDGRGKFLIPGLADMHTHLGLFGLQPERVLPILVANGITTLRNVDYTGGEYFLKLRARVAAREILGPRIYTSGFLSGETKDSSTDQLVRSYKEAGYDFIKIHDGYVGEELDSLAVAAHRAGIPFMGHVYDSLERILPVGSASMEHLIGYPADDPTRLRALAVATQRAGVWNCPTQVLVEIFPTVSDDSINQWPEARYLTDETRERIKNWQGPGSVSGLTRDASRQVIKALQDAGAGLLSGTDTPIAIPGFSLHHELQGFVLAGLTPYQALTTSTRNVAAYFGTLNESGTVAVGKRADLVLLRGNPLVDIRNTTQPAGVMLNGRWLAQAALDRMEADWVAHR